MDLQAFKPLITSWLAGLLLFFVNLLVVLALRPKDELGQVRGMITSMRAAVLLVLLAQMPLFYMGVTFSSPVEAALTAYGSEGRSWLYYIGRPATTFLGALFGFFSDIHYSFRYVWRCPLRGVWSASLLSGYVMRDLIGLVINLWALMVESYLLVYIGWSSRCYYTYRMLTVGEDNRLMQLEEVYRESFPDIHDKFFGVPSSGGLSLSMKRGPARSRGEGRRVMSGDQNAGVADTAQAKAVEEGLGGAGAGTEVKSKKTDKVSQSLQLENPNIKVVKFT